MGVYWVAVDMHEGENDVLPGLSSGKSSDSWVLNILEFVHSFVRQTKQKTIALNRKVIIKTWMGLWAAGLRPESGDVEVVEDTIRDLIRFDMLGWNQDNLQRRWNEG